MNETLRLTISQDGASPMVVEASLPIEFGRADPNRPVADSLLRPVPCDGGMRIAVAEPSELHVSRRQAILGPGSPIRLANMSTSIAIEGPDGIPLPPEAALDLEPPFSFRIGRFRIAVAAAADRSATAAPDSRSQPSSRLATMFGETLTAAGTPEMRDFVRWWQQVISLLQSASSSTDFFHKAAESLVDLVGLDLGAVFLRVADGWQPAALAARGETRSRPSSQVLGRVLAERRTIRSDADQEVDMGASLARLEAYVAAPIVDGDGRVLGVLYGHRSGDPLGGGRISELESLLVETLACGVAAGLARVEQEAIAVRQKVTFGQFFSPEIAARLEAEPDLLHGRDAEISVLFCDIRGFSGFSERLGPAQTMDWIGAALSAFSERVLETGGVLVDYVGDELMAMWGAPSPQADHATLACAAARAIVASLQEIDERWSSVIGGSTRVGIGINSGVARVGNTGSTRKFKYGPLGNCVNIASRVRGATRFLRVDAVVTGSTRRLLAPSTRVRRLCTVQLVNIAEPQDLFELDCGQSSRSAELFAAYEQALAAFEATDFSRAARLLGSLLDAFPGDGPSLVLLSRAVDEMVAEPRPFSPVWRLPGK